MEKNTKISVGGMMEEFKESKATDKAKQKKQEGGGVPNPKGKGSRWRLDQRPNAKNIHFDDTLNKRINLLSQLENKPIEDILYDIISEWFDKHFDERKKELLGQL